MLIPLDLSIWIRQKKWQSNFSTNLKKDPIIHLKFYFLLNLIKYFAVEIISICHNEIFDLFWYYLGLKNYGFKPVQHPGCISFDFLNSSLFGYIFIPHQACLSFSSWLDFLDLHFLDRQLISGAILLQKFWKQKGQIRFLKLIAH